MKIYGNQLSQALSSENPSVFLISGDDPLLVQEAHGEILQSLKKKGVTEHIRFDTAKNFDWNMLAASSDNFSLFAEKRVFDLLCHGSVPSEKITPVVKTFLNHTDDFLILRTEKIAPTQKLSWVSSIEKQGLWITIYPPTGSHHVAWVKQRLQKHQLNINSAALELLIAYTDGNLLACQQEIEKLAILYPSSLITEKELLAAISVQSRYTVFDLVDECLAGNATKVITILFSLEQESFAPPLLLWALQKEIRELATMADALSKGQHLSDIFTQKRIWKTRQPLFQAALKRADYSEWIARLQEALSLDRLIKGIDQGFFWDALSSWCLRICGQPLGVA